MKTDHEKQNYLFGIHNIEILSHFLNLCQNDQLNKIGETEIYLKPFIPFFQYSIKGNFRINFDIILGLAVF